VSPVVIGILFLSAHQDVESRNVCLKDHHHSDNQTQPPISVVECPVRGIVFVAITYSVGEDTVYLASVSAWPHIEKLLDFSFLRVIQVQFIRRDFSSYGMYLEAEFIKTLCDRALATAEKYCTQSLDIGIPTLLRKSPWSRSASLQSRGSTSSKDETRILIGTLHGRADHIRPLLGESLWRLIND
jgi:hypothetical protein